MQTGDPDLLTVEGKVFLDEQLEIRRLAMEGPAIFLGHCASDALREQKSVIKVFIYSENENEVKRRIVEDYGIAPEEAETTRRHFNKKRAGYFRANTGNDWKDLKNYDVVLDSSKLGIEGCVNVLKGLYRSYKRRLHEKIRAQIRCIWQGVPLVPEGPAALPAKYSCIYCNLNCG